MRHNLHDECVREREIGNFERENLTRRVRVLFHSTTIFINEKFRYIYLHVTRVYNFI